MRLADGPALQPLCAGYTVRIVRFTLAPAVEPSRPKGVGLSALALGALTLIDLVRGLFSHGGDLVFEPLLLCCGRGLVLLLLWHYWKGRNWARILVLLWSFAVAAKEISILIDREGDLPSLMSQPVRFSHAVLAIFLLYFLNTRPVRAWFKKMSASAADLIAEHLVGKLCIAVGKHRDGPSDAWRLAFEHDAELTLNGPWRIVMDDNLAFASNSTNESADEQPSHLLENLRVKAVRVAPRTSDLFVSFEMGIELQSWTTAPQSQPPPVQQWKYSDPTLAVLADSVGVNPQAIAVSIPGEDAAEND